MRQIARLSLRDLLYVLCRDRWKIAASMVAALAVAGAWLFLLADTIYVAESRVLVRLGREKLTGIETLTRENANFLFQERGQDINNTIELLRDPQFIYPVMDKLAAGLAPATAAPPQGFFALAKAQVKKLVAGVMDVVTAPLYWLGLRQRLAPEEALAQALRGALRAEGMEDTDIVRVMFGWPDPVFAAQAANTVVDALLARQVQVYGSQAPGQFYNEQIVQQTAKLREAERALDAFRARHDITNLTLQKELLLREVTDVEARRNEVDLRLHEHRALAAWLQAEVARRDPADAPTWPTTPEVRGKPVLDAAALDRQYYDLAARRNQLQSTHLANAPELAQIAQRMTALRRQKLDAIGAHNRAALDIDQREQQALAGLLEGKRARLARLNTASAELAELERVRNTQEAVLAASTKKSEELRVAELLNDKQISGLRVMSPARAPVLPAAPKKALVLGLALLIGLLLGLAYSALLEYFDHSFRGDDDVRNLLGVPLLMTVPRLRGRAARQGVLP